MPRFRIQTQIWIFLTAAEWTDSRVNRPRHRCANPTWSPASPTAFPDRPTTSSLATTTGRWAAAGRPLPSGRKIRRQFWRLRGRGSSRRDRPTTCCFETRFSGNRTGDIGWPSTELINLVSILSCLVVDKRQLIFWHLCLAHQGHRLIKQDWLWAALSLSQKNFLQSK